MCGGKFSVALHIRFYIRVYPRSFLFVKEYDGQQGLRSTLTIRVTKWHQDHSRGTYPHIATGVNKKSRFPWGRDEEDEEVFTVDLDGDAVQHKRGIWRGVERRSVTAPRGRLQSPASHLNLTKGVWVKYDGTRLRCLAQCVTQSDLFPVYVSVSEPQYKTRAAEFHLIQPDLGYLDCSIACLVPAPHISKSCYFFMACCQDFSQFHHIELQ